MFTLKRKHQNRTVDELRVGWPVGQWEGTDVWYYPSMRHGQPAVTAHGLAQMVWRELATFGPNPPKELYLSKRSLLAGTGKTWSQKNRLAGEIALGQIADSYLQFKTPHPTKEGASIIRRVRLLQEMMVEEDDNTGNVESVVLRLSDFAHESLINKDVLLFNWARLAELGGDPIAINLAKYNVHRGYQLMDRKSGQPNFSTKTGLRKDYWAVCDEYLGGLTHQRKLSDVKRQLDKAFKAIHRARFGAMYVKKSKSTPSGFVVIFKPLDGFYNDYESLIRAPKRRAPAHDKIHQDNDDNTAPVRLASYFHVKMGRAASHTLTKSEVSYLRTLRRTYEYSDIERLIDYVAGVCTRNGRVPDRANVLATWVDRWNKQQAEQAAKKEQRASVVGCRLCNAEGMVMLAREDGTLVAHRCPHSPGGLLNIAREKGLFVPSQGD